MLGCTCNQPQFLTSVVYPSDLMQLSQHQALHYTLPQCFVPECMTAFEAEQDVVPVALPLPPPADACHTIACIASPLHLHEMELYASAG